MFDTRIITKDLIRQKVIELRKKFGRSSKKQIKFDIEYQKILIAELHAQILSTSSDTLQISALGSSLFLGFTSIGLALRPSNDFIIFIILGIIALLGSFIAIYSNIKTEKKLVEAYTRGNLMLIALELLSG